MKKAIWTIIIIVILILIVWALVAVSNQDEADDNQDTETRAALIERARAAGLDVTEDSLLVDLDEENDSDISGVAVLTELENDRTRVAVSLDNAAGESRPIHIHSGRCANLGDVLYSLNQVEDGFSNSEVFATFEELEAGAPLAINAHESAEAIQSNIACGNIDFDQIDAGASDDEDDEEDTDTGTTTDEGDEDEEDTEATATIRYTESGFVPSELVVARGTTVRFVNESSGNMWVASANHPTHEILPAFDQLAAVAIGADYEFTFTQEGTWNFHNHVSANHTGRVVVQ